MRKLVMSSVAEDHEDLVYPDACNPECNVCTKTVAASHTFLAASTSWVAVNPFALKHALTCLGLFQNKVREVIVAYAR